MNKDKLIQNAFIVGAVYFLIGKPILKFLGIAKGAGAQLVDQNLQDPNSAFNTGYWRNFFYAGNTKPNGRKPLTAEMLGRMRKAANIFYYGFGVFGEDENAIFNALKMAKSKAEISLMANLVQLNYQGNVLSLMKYGKTDLPNSGLSDSELETVFKIVSNLPNS